MWLISAIPPARADLPFDRPPIASRESSWPFNRFSNYPATRRGRRIPVPGTDRPDFRTESRPGPLLTRDRGTLLRRCQSNSVRRPQARRVARVTAPVADALANQQLHRELTTPSPFICSPPPLFTPPHDRIPPGILRHRHRAQLLIKSALAKCIFLWSPPQQRTVHSLTARQPGRQHSISGDNTLRRAVLFIW
ncbi:hypothetical protein J6590_018070 [Homalodisca vitripennis]|nr:hypothetical protein J6590_018070 [Homalodisca vitripennis]